MCTVSFIRNQDAFVLTSNRDENINRPSALDPKVYLINGRKVVYPKDPKGNGTWFAINDLGSSVILLNGAEEKHISKSKYRISRGLVVLDLISAIDAEAAWNEIDLNEVEPFTIILFCSSNLNKLQWDGKEKSTQTLDCTQNYIWSSSTLYSQKIREKREYWFKTFTTENTFVGSEDMINFHSNTEPDDFENGLRINRNEGIMTKNITQVVFQRNKSTITHINLMDNTKVTKSILSF